MDEENNENISDVVLFGVELLIIFVVIAVLMMTVG